MIQNKSNLIGLILAGGLSTRMNKEHKFLKKINKKKTLMEVIIERALKQVPKLIINANINVHTLKHINSPSFFLTISINVSLLDNVSLSLPSSNHLYSNIKLAGP